MYTKLINFGADLARACGLTGAASFGAFNPNRITGQNTGAAVAALAF